ncbi:MauE/DoxX family redox-associated membrane protein [Streptomyces jumonjinensis]
MIYLVFACRILLAGVFLTALAGKVRNKAAFDEFAVSVERLGRLPRRVSRAVAVAVAAGEAAAVALLAAGPTVPAGFALGVLLLLGFTAGIVRALRAGSAAPCRCFGASVTPLGPVHVVRNLVLAAVGGAGGAAALTGPATGWPPHPGGAAVAGVAALVALVLVVRLDDLTALFRLPPARTGPVGRAPARTVPGRAAPARTGSPGGGEPGAS